MCACVRACVCVCACMRMRVCMHACVLCVCVRESVCVCLCLFVWRVCAYACVEMCEQKCGCVCMYISMLQPGSKFKNKTTAKLPANKKYLPQDCITANHTQSKQLQLLAIVNSLFKLVHLLILTSHRGDQVPVTSHEICFDSGLFYCHILFSILV